MPSLIRLLIAIAIMVGGLYGGAYALVTLYEPAPREMSEKVRDLRLENVPDAKPNVVGQQGAASKPVTKKQ